MKKNEIYVIYGRQLKENTKKLLEKCELNKHIKSGASIGIKPNILGQILPEEGATTHPEIVAGIIEYLQDNGHKDVIILEGAWVGDNTEKSFKYLGYDKISREYGVELFDTKKDTFVSKTYDGITMEISKRALDLDFLINVPVLKGHCQTMITGAMKNLKGIISDREKRHFHSLGLHRPIAYLNKHITADFVVLDGICGDLDFEEGGNPVEMNRICAGLDSVLIDSYIASSMGYLPNEIEHIRLANSLGVGSSDIDGASIIELNEDRSPARATSSRKVKALEPYIEQKEACSACYANLIQALYRLSERGRLSSLIKDKVYIGQGFKGVSKDALGVGICTGGFAKSCPGCPAKARDIMEFILDN